MGGPILGNGFGPAGDMDARAGRAALKAGINLFDTADIYGFNGRHGFGDAETLLV